MKSNKKYVDRWEDSRQYQNELIITTTCDGFQDIIDKVNKNIELENIAHTEIQAFMQQQCEVRKIFLKN